MASQDDKLVNYGFIIVCVLYYSQGQPAELSSKFIRYSTFKLGKEQLVSLKMASLSISLYIISLSLSFPLCFSLSHSLPFSLIASLPLALSLPLNFSPPSLQVNSASLESLLQRLVKASHVGPDFLNTFFMTLPLYTDTHTVMGFLAKSYRECVEKKEKGRRASLSPQEAVRGARGEAVRV